MSGIPFDGWVDEAYYQKEMAKMHKINPKLDVIQILFDQFTRLDDPNFRPLGWVSLSTEERKWLQVELSAQIVALTMELTDDLAFVCEAYLRAIDAGTKDVATRLANLQREDADKFYQRVSKDAGAAAKARGFGESDSRGEEYRVFFERIRKYREHFWMFYNGYKHGQYATPIVTGPTGSQKWGLYLIPKDFKRDNSGKIHTAGEDRFVDTVNYAGEFLNLAKAAHTLWMGTVSRQFPKVYGT